MNHALQLTPYKPSISLHSVPDLQGFHNRKYHLKAIRTLNFVPSKFRRNEINIRSYKSVKYIVNLNHLNPEGQRLENHILSQKRNYNEQITLKYPKNNKEFLKRVRSAKELYLDLPHSQVEAFTRSTRQSIKKIANLQRLQFIANLDQPTLTEEMLLFMKIYSRRSIFAFKIPKLTYHRSLAAYNPYFYKLRALMVNDIDHKLLAMLLLKASAFDVLDSLDLGTLQIEEEFPSYLAHGFGRFPVLKKLKLKVYCNSLELSQEFLSKFKLSPSVKLLDLSLHRMRFPHSLNSTDEDYFAYESFVKNLESGYNVENVVLRIHISENFQGANRMLAKLPLNLTKVKKLYLEILPERENNVIYEDTRVVMRHVMKWIFAMPQLEDFDLEALNRDYTDISTIQRPERLPWKEFDILEYPEESQDTLRHEDYTTFLQILQSAKEIRILNLSIECSHFGLEEFKRLGATVSELRTLKHMSLKLNCRKFSPYDYELLEPCLRPLKNLKTLSLMFISDGVKEVDVWRYKLSKTFENFQKLDNFNLSMFSPSQPVFVRNYYSNGASLQNSASMQMGIRPRMR